MKIPAFNFPVVNCLIIILNMEEKHGKHIHNGETKSLKYKKTMS